MNVLFGLQLHIVTDVIDSDSINAANEAAGLDRTK